MQNAKREQALVPFARRAPLARSARAHVAPADHHPRNYLGSTPRRGLRAPPPPPTKSPDSPEGGRKLPKADHSPPPPPHMTMPAIVDPSTASFAMAELFRFGSSSSSPRDSIAFFELPYAVSFLPVALTGMLMPAFFMAVRGE